MGSHLPFQVIVLRYQFIDCHSAKLKRTRSLKRYELQQFCNFSLFKFDFNCNTCWNVSNPLQDIMADIEADIVI